MLHIKTKVGWLQCTSSPVELEIAENTRSVDHIELFFTSLKKGHDLS